MICNDLCYFPVICKYLISGCVSVSSQITVMIIRTNENSESSPMDQLLPALLYIRNFRVCMTYYNYYFSPVAYFIFLYGIFDTEFFLLWYYNPSGLAS